MNQPTISPTTAEIHAAVDWRLVLSQLGLNIDMLTNRHGPCPACEGKDRFRFDDRYGRGTWICGAGGQPIAGDGFDLLMHVYGWNFSEARKQVIQTAGLRYPDHSTSFHSERDQSARMQTENITVEIARPTRRVLDLLNTSAPVDSVADVIAYLDSRKLLPIPPDSDLRAHAAAEYWDSGHVVSKFPALLAPVRDIDGDLVTLHVTYLQDGQKLNIDGLPCRKILSKMTGRKGCVVTLSKPAETLGIAEGIETALAASHINSVPVWSCLSASMLVKWTPPLEVHHVMIFADRDVAGLKAAWRLRKKLDGKCTVELKTPPAPFNDWAEALEVKS